MRLENKIKHVNLENKIEHLEGNTKDSTMLAFAVALSIDENKKYNIYYDPASRSHNYPFKYIGLYHDKEIVAVGEVKKIIYCDYNIEKKKLIPTDGKELNLTEDEYDRIKDTILNTPYYDLEEGNKFFLVDNFYPTHFKKSSDYALRAKKYFWLNEIIGFHDGMTAAELAKLLSGREWE